MKHQDKPGPKFSYFFDLLLDNEDDDNFELASQKHASTPNAQNQISNMQFEFGKGSKKTSDAPVPKKNKESSKRKSNGGEEDLQRRKSKGGEESIRRERFTAEEDKKIMELYPTFGTDWALYEVHMTNRSRSAIKTRYINSLDPNRNTAPFTAQEDEKLMTLQKKLGNKWAEIALEIPGRTNYALNSRYHVLEKHQKQESVTQEEEVSNNKTKKRSKQEKDLESRKETKLEDDSWGASSFYSDPIKQDNDTRSVEPPKVSKPEKTKRNEEDVEKKKKKSKPVMTEIGIDADPIPVELKVLVDEIGIDPVVNFSMEEKATDPQGTKEEMANVGSIASWLKSLKMQDLTENFQKAGINNLDDLLLENVDNEFLINIGVTKQVYRILILEEIAALKDQTRTIEQYLKFHKWTYLADRFKEMGIDNVELLKHFGKRRIFSIVTNLGQ